MYVTREELEKILLLKIEPIENSLNFNGDEFKKLLSRMETREKTATNLFYSNRSLTELEVVLDNNLKFVFSWIMANLLDKTNFIIFHPPQKSTSHVVKLLIAKREIKQEKFIKYLGLHINSNLSWEFHILHIKRFIGILFKIRYFVSQQVLVQLYYTLIYPFLT